MRQVPVAFFIKHPSFYPKEIIKIKEWIHKVVNREKYELQSLNVIILSDKALLKLNKDYLKHDYYTDVLSFDQSENKRVIEGEIYISGDRIKENAIAFKVKQMEEFRRVIIHGVLHLLGYKDKTEKDKKLIKQKEDQYLNIY